MVLIWIKTQSKTDNAYSVLRQRMTVAPFQLHVCVLVIQDVGGLRSFVAAHYQDDHHNHQHQGADHSPRDFDLQGEVVSLLALRCSCLHHRGLGARDMSGCVGGKLARQTGGGVAGVTGGWRLVWVIRAVCG